MDELEDVTLHVWSDINLIFSIGDHRPRSKFVNNLSACKRELPESECTHTVTTFDTRDCCKVWDEAKRTNNTDRLIKLFEICSQLLLQRFKDDDPTDKDKSVLVNFLCLNGVVKRQKVNMTSLDGEPLNDSLQVLKCTELGPTHQTVTKPPHIDGSVQGPPHQITTKPLHIGDGVQGPPHQITTQPPHIAGVAIGQHQQRSSIVQQIYQNIKRTTQKPPENRDLSTSGPPEKVDKSVTGPPEKLDTSLNGSPENVNTSVTGQLQNTANHMHGQPGVLNTEQRLPHKAVRTVQGQPELKDRTLQNSLKIESVMKRLPQQIGGSVQGLPQQIGLGCNKILLKVTRRCESQDDGVGKTKVHLPNKRVKLNHIVTDSSSHGNHKDIIATANESVLQQITSAGEWTSSDGNIVVKEEIDSGAEDDGHDDDSVQNHFVVVGNMKSENGSYDNTSAAYSSSDVTMTNKSNVTKNNTATNGIVYVKQIKNSKMQENLQHVMFLCPNQVPEDYKEVLCLWCGKSFGDKKDLINHQKSDKSSECNQCNKIFDCESQLQHHRRIHDRQSFECAVCKKRFEDESDCLTHRKSHELFECDQCNKTFARKYQLQKHLQIHEDIRPFECTECDKSFRQKMSLDSHLRIHTGEKPFQCRYCSEVFRDKRTFNRHEWNHIGDSPFPCVYCEKGFQQRSSLADHMTTHTGEKPHLCDVCGKAFSCKRTLDKHMVTHTGEKNYCCEVCSKKFTAKSYLRTHMRVHTGETPYQCDICGKLFKQSSNLISHKKVHKKDQL
ncbi:uncharacterized protein LOC144450232 isoform X1 [Glandiceps talaboti]